MNSQRKDKIYKLLKAIETGDANSVKVVNEDKYIQHNPSTHEGGEGLAVLFKRLSKTNPKVELIRVFEDGDFVFARTIYDLFRIEEGKIVEHWDTTEVVIPRSEWKNDNGKF